jgi:sugar lactone lactonase YvrE
MSAQTAPARPTAQLVDVQPARDFTRLVAREYHYIIENTIQPFAPGDIFLGCTYLNDPTDDHAGLGRILQYDAGFKPKGVLWTEGHRHLVMGLNFDRDGMLWGFDIHTQAVLRVDRYGRQLPTEHLLGRAFGSAAFAADGSIYLGETLKGSKPYWGSLMKYIPGTNRIGDGHVFKFDRNLKLLDEYPTETATELSGFKGVTHLALHPSGKYIAYTTETGKRLMRYDVVNRAQMPDLARIEGGDLYDRNWFIALAYLQDGRLLVTRGDTVDLYAEDGKLLRNYSLKQFGYGFAQVAACHDQRHALASNIFTGAACKFSLETGEVVAQVQTDHGGQRRSLAGIAEFPGA